MQREEFYAFLGDTLHKARSFLCGLAQYKFPAGVKVKYFASNSEKTDASFEIRKEKSWLPWRPATWVIDDVARAPWIDGDGTVPMFVGRNLLARGLPGLEDTDATERQVCEMAHSSLLNCKAFAAYIRDVIAIAKNSQAVAANSYLDAHPAEKVQVLQTLASANVYLDCRLLPGGARQGASFSGCPVNDAIRERSGVSAATLLAEVKSEPPTPDKANKIEVVANMQGLDAPARVRGGR
jgi:hypothetical protein